MILLVLCSYILPDRRNTTTTTIQWNESRSTMFAFGYSRFYHADIEVSSNRLCLWCLINFIQYFFFFFFYYFLFLPRHRCDSVISIVVCVLFRLSTATQWTFALCERSFAWRSNAFSIREWSYAGRCDLVSMHSINYMAIWNEVSRG